MNEISTTLIAPTASTKKVTSTSIDRSIGRPRMSRMPAKAAERTFSVPPSPAGTRSMRRTTGIAARARNDTASTGHGTWKPYHEMSTPPTNGPTTPANAVTLWSIPMALDSWDSLTRVRHERLPCGRRDGGAAGEQRDQRHEEGRGGERRARRRARPARSSR